MSKTVQQIERDYRSNMVWLRGRHRDQVFQWKGKPVTIGRMRIYCAAVRVLLQRIRQLEKENRPKQEGT